MRPTLVIAALAALLATPYPASAQSYSCSSTNIGSFINTTCTGPAGSYFYDSTYNSSSGNSSSSLGYGRDRYGDSYSYGCSSSSIGSFSNSYCYGSGGSASSSSVYSSGSSYSGSIRSFERGGYSSSGSIIGNSIGSYDYTTIYISPSSSYDFYTYR